MKYAAVVLLCLASIVLAVSALRARTDRTNETECQRKRRDAERQVADQERHKNQARLAIVVPNCDTEGNYAQLQCHYGSPFCQCWDKEGIPLTQPKKDLRKCGCMSERAKALRNMPASQQGTAYLTECDTTGNFKARQCDRSACWCVNPDNGKKLTAENRDKSSVVC